MDFALAIDQRRRVSFEYDGHPRVIESAALGYHISTGNLFVRGYQVGGTSSSRAIPLWDMFLIEKIVEPSMLDETFDEDPPFYKRGDKHMSRIVAEL